MFKVFNDAKKGIYVKGQLRNDSMVRMYTGTHMRALKTTELYTCTHMHTCTHQKQFSVFFFWGGGLPAVPRWLLHSMCCRCLTHWLLCTHGYRRARR